ncbi:response regulator [candidate division KSB1 bacterium]|nr:response regulator [candidate division KSB1 bacterium]
MILIVEDESIYRRAITEILEVSGLQGEVATDGYQAMQNLEKKHYSLAIVDLVLPGPVNGFDVIKKIKTTSPGTHIIAMSGYGNQSLVQKTYKAGADLFIPKPFKPEKLAMEVEKLLQIKKTEVEPTPKTESSTIDIRTIPEIFNGFSRDTLIEIIKLGKVFNLLPTEKYQINYTESIALIISGSAECWLGNTNIGVLQNKESLGQESLLKKADPNAILTFEAQAPLKLFIVPRIRLIKYLHANNQIPTFEKNIKISLHKNLILKAKQKTNSNISNPVQSPPVSQQNKSPQIKNDNLDFDSIEKLDF